VKDVLGSALLCCAPASGVRKDSFPGLTRHLLFSAPCAPRDVPGYYRPSLAGLLPKLSETVSPHNVFAFDVIAKGMRFW